MSLERAKAFADAVLLEGGVLSPSRASSAKNKYRSTFGVLAPREWSEAGGCEPWWMQAELLVEPMGVAQLDGVLRFLNPRGPGEGELQEISLRLPLTEASGEERVVEFDVAPAVAEATDDVACGVIRICVEPAQASRPLLRVRIRVENVAPWANPEAEREEVLRSSCASTHLLLGVTGGEFVSQSHPPEWARGAVEACRNVRSFPVLAGARGRRELMLASPILLEDHSGDFFDATERGPRDRVDPIAVRAEPVEAPVDPAEGLDDADRMWMRGRMEDARLESTRGTCDMRREGPTPLKR